MKIGLCRGRHEICGITEYIFDNSVDPLDPSGLEAQAIDFLKKVDGDSIDLYVTGLSVALVAVINACVLSGMELTLWHFDRDSGSYYPQKVAGTRPCRNGGYYQCC